METSNIKDRDRPTFPDSIGRPTQPMQPPEKLSVIDKVDPKLFNEEYDSSYPYGDLEVGQAFFIPNEQNQSTLQNLDTVHKSIAKARTFYAEPEVNENGDEVWETVTIKHRHRNTDQTFKLTGDDKPIETAEMLTRPRLISSRHFVAYPILKGYDYGSKAETDGVLVVRVD